ncbi:MAG: hypothetical protein HYV34_03585 [Candidatus Kerfeldbacteria bacterium]|nr:hypothetical protein [Candidatus Kerfeldbacteria bacterium]
MSKYERAKKGEDQPITKGYFEERLGGFQKSLEKSLDEKFEKFARMMQTEFQHVHDRIDRTNNHLGDRIDRTNERLDRISVQFDELNHRLLATNDLLYRHLDDSSTKHADIHYAIRTQETWIKRAARKVNVRYPVPAHR